MSWIWEPSKEFVESTNVWQFLQRLGCRNRKEFLRFSVEHLEEFWAQMVGESGIEWFTPYDQVLDASAGVEWARWFTGGKLNIVRNCLDRHVRRKNPAIVWEGEKRRPSRAFLRICGFSKTSAGGAFLSSTFPAEQRSSDAFCSRCRFSR